MPLLLKQDSIIALAEASQETLINHLTVCIKPDSCNKPWQDFSVTPVTLDKMGMLQTCVCGAAPSRTTTPLAPVQACPEDDAPQTNLIRAGGDMVDELSRAQTDELHL